MSELPEGYKDLVLALTVPGLYCFMVLLGRRLKRRHGVRLGSLYHLFSFCLALYLPAVGLNLHWGVLRHLGAAVVILGAVFVIALIERFVFELYLQARHGVAVPRFLTEVSRLVILAFALFLVLEFAYDQTIKGLLIAPGIAAVVIGLAMQDLVGNIIAGLALQASKSFVHGDWLLIEHQHAQVVEINWRATQLRTLDDILIEVPNREVARQTIVNLNRPQRRHAVRIPVMLDYSDPPTRAKDVLLHAVANAKGVCPEPKPAVYLKSFGDYGIEYEIKFWMDDHQHFPEVADAVRTNVWYGLKRHGLRIPYPTRTVQLERPARDKQQEVQLAARIILRNQPLFKCLADEQLDALLPRGRVVHFGRGEKLIEQGQNGDSMFIMVEGEASVIAERNGVTRPVASLKAGDCFGEMSLLTGEQRMATVVANADCEVVEIGKPVLAKTLKEHPELLRELGELLAARQLETENAFSGTPPNTATLRRQTTYAAGFLEKLRHFFEL
jgi:small-conductance mechanosensitive channel/CRP-like cAMP-binding protein